MLARALAGATAILRVSIQSARLLAKSVPLFGSLIKLLILNNKIVFLRLVGAILPMKVT